MCRRTPSERRALWTAGAECSVDPALAYLNPAVISRLRPPAPLPPLRSRHHLARALRIGVMKRLLASMIVTLTALPLWAAPNTGPASISDGKSFQGWEGDTNKTW